MPSKIGIGVSTFNRQETLVKTLLHLCKFTLTDKVIAVSDDGSTDGTPAAVEQFWTKHPYETEHHLIAEENGGISKNKNRLIKYFLDRDDIEFIFLIEDDVRPRSLHWEMSFINTCKAQQQAHLLYLPKTKWGENPYGPNIGKTGKHPYVIDWKANPSGLVMFFTPKLLAHIGGFNEEFAEYGWEHNELTARALVAQNIDPIFKQVRGQPIQGFYPHCSNVEQIEGLESDDMRRRPMWNHQELAMRKDSSTKYTPLYCRLMVEHRKKLTRTGRVTFV